MIFTEVRSRGRFFSDFTFELRVCSILEKGFDRCIDTCCFRIQDGKMKGGEPFVISSIEDSIDLNPIGL